MLSIFNTAKERFQPYINRIQHMSVPEIAWRIWQVSCDKRDFILRKSCAPSLKLPSKFRPLIDLSQIDLAICRLQWEQNSWHDSILGDLLNGRYHFITDTFDIGGEIDWHYDVTTGSRLPLIQGRKFLFQKMYKMANILFVRTLNRHYHFVHLAKGIRLGKCDVNTLKKQMICWIRSNPYLEGINWADSLDISNRLLHWCLSLTFSGIDSDDLQFQLEVQNSIYQQASFIEKHLSLFSSANNHLLGEFIGLFVVGFCFPEMSEANRWLQIGKEGIENEVARQWSSEGVHREQSLCYQRILLEHLLLVSQACQSVGEPFSHQFKNRISHGVSYVAECLNAAGEAPFIGDYGQEVVTDMHYMSFKTTNSWLSLIRLARCLGFFDDEMPREWLPDADERTCWIALNKEVDANLPPGRFRRSKNLAESGISFLRDERSFAEETCLIFRCGPMGYPETCAHAHADQLSFVLSVCGKQMIVDPGTYSYYFRGQKWRNYFRGTTAHNTLACDWLDQAESGGSMIWMNKAHGNIREWSSENGETFVSGYHNGYLRLTDPVLHSRSIRLNSRSKQIEIWDDIQARDKHEIGFFLHFHPHVRLERIGNNTFRGWRGSEKIVINIDGYFSISLLLGNDDEPAGWYSPHFEYKEPCPTIRGTCFIDGSCQFKCIIEY